MADAWVQDAGGPKAHERLEGLFSASRSRFTDQYDHAVLIDDTATIEALEMFRKDIDTYVRLYDFLSQIIDYGNTDLERKMLKNPVIAAQVRNNTPQQVAASPRWRTVSSMPSSAPRIHTRT